MYDEGLLSDGYMMEILSSHTNVVFQPPVTHPATADSTRMRWASRCSGHQAHLPDSTTRTGLVPETGRTDWIKSLDYAMRHFKERELHRQYLSPKLDARLPMFAILDDAAQSELEVSAIHDDQATGRCAGRSRGKRPGLARAQHPGVELSTPAATAR